MIKLGRRCLHTLWRGSSAAELSRRPGQNAGARSTRTSKNLEGGFALIPVLAAMGLIGFIALVMTKTVSTDVKVTNYFLQQAKAESLANGLAQLVAYRLGNQASVSQHNRLNVDGAPMVCRMGEAVATIEVFDTAGLIDINAAPFGVLEVMFSGVGVPAIQAKDLANAVVDFRTGGDNHELSADDYKKAGRSMAAKNAPFTTVGELEQVLGMTRGIFLRVQPLVTTWSRLANVDPNVASKQVLALQLPTVELAKTSIARTYKIRVVISGAGRSTFVREAIVELSGRGPAGFRILEWSKLYTGAAASLLQSDIQFESCVDALIG